MRCKERQKAATVKSSPIDKIDRGGGFRRNSKRGVRNEPLIYIREVRAVGRFEKPLTLFEEYAFRPQIVQEAAQPRVTAQHPFGGDPSPINPIRSMAAFDFGRFHSASRRNRALKAHCLARPYQNSAFFLSSRTPRPVS